MHKKTALITGGARGIGLGISVKLAEERWDLALCGRRDITEVKDVLEDLRSTGIKVEYYQADISGMQDHGNLINRVKEDFGCLHLLINNAGVAPLKRVDILEADEESYDRVMNINLKGPYFLTRDCAKWMIGQQKTNREYKACIINISSISAVTASPERGEYCLSKAGISMATKLWAAGLGKYDIPVYEIQPGIIKTDMTGAVEEKYTKLIEGGLLVQSRWGLPEDVGKVAASFARGDMAFSTGQVVRVDGGLTLQRL